MYMRSIRPDDVPDMVPLAEAFYEQAGLPGHVEPTRFIANWQEWINAGIGVAVGLFNDDGELAGTAGGLMVAAANDGRPEANEMFWYVLPEHRGGAAPIRLFLAWEKVCVDAGARRISMIRLWGPEGERIGRWLESRGYRPVEVHYYRILED